MNIAFRVDLSGTIGTGHFSRCLTIAQSLKQAGVYVKFICRFINDASIYALEKAGIDLHIIDYKNQIKSVLDYGCLRHSSWLGDSQESDAALTLNALSSNDWDCIFVDHYGIDFIWESIVKDKCKKLFVIDDLADRTHLCDYLLDQNFYKNMHLRYEGKVPKSCKLFLGPSFLQLRPEFHAYKQNARVRSGEVRNILVFFGGADPENLTLKALQAIVLFKRKFEIHVVVGAANPNAHLLKDFCKNYKFQYHFQVNDMARLMQNADISIGALGASTWERCYLGLPAIVSPIADNQVEAFSVLIENNLIFSLGDIKASSILELAERIHLILDKKSDIKTISSNCLNLFHNNAADTLISSLINDLK